ncbi:MAG: hydrogenase iron-sulfur subunit [Candidatus Hodarchaeales archaeon]|jgi:heterodisulfide reductase subunit A-like polyferredoxin/coenzyme F420-reducing hydrogenase delta subunit
MTISRTNGMQAVICTCNNTNNLTKDLSLIEKMFQSSDRKIKYQIVADFCKKTSDYKGNLLAFACSEHELGHYFLERDDTNVSHVDIKRLGSNQYKESERRAIISSLFKGALMDLEYNKIHPKRKITIKKKVIITGSGISAMITAERVSREQDIHVTMLSKEKINDSTLNKMVMSEDNLGQKLSELKTTLSKRNNVEILEEITSIHKKGHLGNFEVTTNLNNGEKRKIEAGIIALTGDFKEFDVAKLNNIPSIDGKKLFTWNNFDPTKLPANSNILIVSCVGSRSIQRPYCSSYCCQTMVKKASELAEKHVVTVLHKGIRTLGTSELIYQEARKKGVKFIAGSYTFADEFDDKFYITTENVLLQDSITIIPDIIVFSSALLPPEEIEFLDTLGLRRLENGFIDPLYTKLRTERTSIPGILISNTLLGPSLAVELEDSAKSLALEILKLLNGDISKRLFATTVNKDTCTGCETCIKNCPTTAITLVDEKASVNQDTCISCELCTIVCPTGAITVENQRENLLNAKIELMTTIYKENTSTPLIYLFACSECGQAAVNMLTELDEVLPATVPVTVSCGSSVSLISVLKCFELGADGLVLAVCRHCHKGKGHEIASGITNIAGQILDHAGLGSWRIAIRETYAHQTDSVLEAVKEISSKISTEGGR